MSDYEKARDEAAENHRCWLHQQAVLHERAYSNSHSFKAGADWCINRLKNCFGEDHGDTALAYALAKSGLADAEQREKILLDALEFYATHRPLQMPDGYYELNISPGEGGHVKHGTVARGALAKHKEMK